MSDTAVLPDVDEQTERKILPPYHVILLNDDFHSMQFVVAVIQKVFGYNQERSVKLMLKVHEQERAIVWTGSKEVAELKQDQVQTFRESKGGTDLGPIGVVIEPAE